MLFVALLVLFSAAITAHAASGDAPRSFSLSTTRTFAPGDSVKIQLFARNVPELEFRVYKVRDAEKFFSGLKDPHSFGVKPYSPSEQIDQETWLERIHDFKAHLWWLIRSFFRGQFTVEARDSILERQSQLGKRSQVVGAAQFARVPLLNESQLVARWKLVVPPALVSENEVLPIDNANGGGLDAGVYLIEATDGTYKAYTVAIVTKIAVVEQTVDGKAFLFVADRKTGAPVDQADVVMWGDGKLQSSGKTGIDGLASLTYTVRGGAQGAEPDNVWILARHGADAAVVTPFGYGFGAQNQQQERDYIYTDRPVYRPGHTVHIKAIVRKEQNDNLVLPDERTLTLRVTGPDDKVVFNKELPVSAHGTVAADFDLASDAALGYYSIDFKKASSNGEAYEGGSGSFYVEEYKKPEYQVTVKVPVARFAPRKFDSGQH